jgi:hypothetical protein
MNSPKYSCAAIREAWEKVGKQRWDGCTHGRGLGLLIVDALTAQGALMLGRLRSPGRTFEFGETRTRSADVLLASATALWSPSSMEMGFLNRKPADGSPSA